MPTLPVPTASPTTTASAPASVLAETLLARPDLAPALRALALDAPAALAIHLDTEAARIRQDRRAAAAAEVAASLLAAGRAGVPALLDALAS